MRTENYQNKKINKNIKTGNYKNKIKKIKVENYKININKKIKAVNYKININRKIKNEN